MISMARPKREEANAPQQVAPQQRTPEQLFWEASLKKGYPTLGYIGQRSEDMENPNQDVITLGFKDSNGLPIPQITLPKAEWIARARLILAKYDRP